MPRKNKSKGMKNGQQQQRWAEVKIGDFRASFPKPRLPRLLGADNLSAQLAYYPRMVKMDVPIILGNITLTAGATASVISVNPTLIANFASRFGSLFQEYCIVGCKFEFRLTAVNNPGGLIMVALDEKSNSSPGAETLGRPHIDIPNVAGGGDSQTTHIIQWVPQDYLDVEWSSVSTTTTPVFVKVYAGGLTGTAGSSSSTVTYTGAIALCFRGFI